MKTCPKCGQTKALGEFAPDAGKKDGHSSHCRACKNASRMERYYRNHDHEKKRKREYGSRPEVRERQRGASTRQWKAMAPDKRWATWLRRRHGLGPAEWQAMRDGQDGLCYLCLQPLPEDRSQVAVDHWHGHCRKGYSCGLCRRGLACPACNTAIGLMGDNAERLRIAAGNLEKAQAIVQAMIISAPQQMSLFANARQPEVQGARRSERHAPQISPSGTGDPRRP